MGEDSLACQNCGHRIEKAESAMNNPAPAPAGPAPSIRYRPTGGTAIVLGWICIAISAICVIVALSRMGAGTYGYGMAALYGQERAVPWVFAAGHIFDSGVFLLVVGYILRAIWFLPGPEHKAMP